MVGTTGVHILLNLECVCKLRIGQQLLYMYDRFTVCGHVHTCKVNS